LVVKYTGIMTMIIEGAILLKPILNNSAGLNVPTLQMIVHLSFICSEFKHISSYFQKDIKIALFKNNFEHNIVKM